MRNKLMLRQALLYARRQPAVWLTPFLFFAIAIASFPIVIGTEASLLQRIAPGIFWIMTLLASLLSLQELFATDFADGTIDYLLVSPNSLTTMVLYKIVSHWIIYNMPLVLLAPILGLFYHLPTQTDLLLMLTLLLGTPSLCLLGAIGCALTLGLKGSSFLLPVLILPLCLPILILATSTISVFQLGLAISPYLMLLASLLLLSLIIAPLITAAALRIGVSA